VGIVLLTRSKAPYAVDVNVASGGVCGSAPTGNPPHALLSLRTLLTESHMYLGGLLGTILVIALVVFVLRRA